MFHVILHYVNRIFYHSHLDHQICIRKTVQICDLLWQKCFQERRNYFEGDYNTTVRSLGIEDSDFTCQIIILLLQYLLHQT